MIYTRSNFLVRIELGRSKKKIFLGNRPSESNLSLKDFVLKEMQTINGSKHS